MTVRALRRGSIAASRVAAASETTYTLNPSADGYLYSASTNYTTARNGAPAVGAVGDIVPGGQHRSGSTRQIYEGFLAFDTSGVVGTIQSVTLSLYGTFDFSTQDYTLQARARDWGPTLETADWVAGDSLAALPLLATYPSASWTTSGYNAFTSEAGFPAAINQSGTTRILLCSDRTIAANDPSTLEYVVADDVGSADANMRPRLIVVTI